MDHTFVAIKFMTMYLMAFHVIIIKKDRLIIFFCCSEDLMIYHTDNLNAWYTYSYLEFLQGLEERVDQDWSGVSSSLEEIRASLLSRNGCLINLTADGKNLENTEKFVGKFLDLLPSNSVAETATWNARISPENEAIVIPTQVLFGFVYLLFNFWYSLSVFFKVT